MWCKKVALERRQQKAPGESGKILAVTARMVSMVERLQAWVSCVLSAPIVQSLCGKVLVARGLPGCLL